MLAPSPHNSQPWAFVWRNGGLECRHDRSHYLPMLDFDRAATWVTFGAVAENIDIASRAIGFFANVTLVPDCSDERLMSAVMFYIDWRTTT